MQYCLLIMMDVRIWNGGGLSYYDSLFGMSLLLAARIHIIVRVRCYISV